MTRALIGPHKPNSIIVPIKYGIKGLQENLSDSVPSINIIRNNANNTVILSIDFEVQHIVIRCHRDFDVFPFPILSITHEFERNIRQLAFLITRIQIHIA